MVFSNAPVDAEPVVDLPPVQPPAAVHAVLFVATQNSVADAPAVTADRSPEKSTVGGAALPPMSTVTRCVAEPPAPSQVSTYVPALLIGPALAEPVTGRVPVHAPDAWQDVAFDALQDSVE